MIIREEVNGRKRKTAVNKALFVAKLLII